MSEPGMVVRGSRPGRAIRRDAGDASEVIRLSNLERYVLRARAGLPIFDDSTSPDAGSLQRLFFTGQVGPR